MKDSLCAYKRGEREFTSYHWCNECPPIDQYNKLLKQHKLEFAARNKKLRESSKKK